MKEFWKKQIVSLKRRPQTIPLVLLVLSCMIYTFHLTEHSNASMYVSSRIVALYVFIITLSSILVIFSFLNAYPKGRRKLSMLLIVFLLIAVQLVLDGLYLNIMFSETMVRDNPVPITQDIADSMNWTMVHLGALAVTTLAILFQPLYHKLLLRIDTTPETEEAFLEIDDGETIVSEDEGDEFIDE